MSEQQHSISVCAWRRWRKKAPAMHAVGYHRVVHSTFLIFLSVIIIQCSYADPLHVTVPQSRLTAARGHSVILGCEFSPDFGQNPDISSLVLTWQRKKDDRVVHSFYYEQNQLNTQDSAYQNRTSLFRNQLNKGNASVKIDNVGVQDAGHYLCIVSTNQGTDKAELQLDYGAFYTEPRLTISVDSSDISVQYETEGFPAPEVMWKGEHGENLSNQTTTSMQSDAGMGLYYIKSSYTAPNKPLNFTFILKNQLLQQHLQRPVIISGAQPSCHKGIIVEKTEISHAEFVECVV
ncbi:hypothetical protein HF521_009750 [Silurus meridionalis]|uniref:Ig-like domain-containing protein n=1 Tax=Silurus meridionalis TaxID=175797 RepID=A0A8T0BV26_SILME|nr:hypothetical protein HF521_009750 [Silurus meridionalis]